jgi:hypothetical protein
MEVDDASYKNILVMLKKNLLQFRQRVLTLLK